MKKFGLLYISFFITTFTIVCILLLFSCSRKKKYTLAATSKGTSYYEVGSLITDLANQNKHFNVTLLSDKELGSFVNCKKLFLGEVDFGIAQNDTKISAFLDSSGSLQDSRIRTVIPLYPEILFIVHSDSIKANNIKELVTNRRIGVGPKNSGTHKFFVAYLKHCGIDSTSYTIVHKPWDENVVSADIDISVNVGGYNASAVNDMLKTKKCKIFSLGDYELFGKGSPVEGFCMNYSTARPFIIPMQTYAFGPEKPILTLAVDAVLLCRKDIPTMEIYNLVELIYKNKKILADKNPLLSALTENFDHNTLNFPLHEGVVKYLERDQPTFMEKNAELLGFVFSILTALGGLIISLRKKRKQAKKDLIDVYLQQLLEIEKRIYQTDSFQHEIYIEIFNDLMRIKQEAFNLLIREKLEPDQTFQIFTQQVQSLTQLLESKKEC